MTMEIASLDIPKLIDYLAQQFRAAPPEGTVVGRTALRDAVAADRGCSQLEAEEIVDSLELLGWLRLVRIPDGPEVWRIGPAPVEAR